MTSPDYRTLEQQYGLSLYPKRDVVLVRGQGATLFDENNKEYIDLSLIHISEPTRPY